MNRTTNRYPLGIVLLTLAACEEVESDSDCPSVLPEATVFCDAANCGASTGSRTFTQARTDPTEGNDWIVISSVSSELFDNDNVEISYGQDTPGALLAKSEGRRPDKGGYALLTEAQQGRLSGERLIRRNTPPWPEAPWQLEGTAIRDITASLLPDGARGQTVQCSADSPACPDGTLCVIPEGDTAGTCAGQLELKWRDQNNPGQFATVTAVVKGVGQRGAVVVETADEASLDDATVNAFLSRFDNHIAPLDEAFFGQPRDTQGRDRDQNGVTLFFFTSRVGQLSPGLVGFFQATDLMDPRTVASSNGADLLYMQPPGPGVTLDNLSATAAHEYQHLINHYAKVINRNSSPESRWLDEGLSSFAEDVLGYGSDAFSNVAVYLTRIGDTSLTGFGLVHGNEDAADSPERRGFAHLLVRFLFEQAGGAQFSGEPGQVSDGGGVAAVRALVQSADTGGELFTRARTGRAFATWQMDLLTAVALDGAGFNGVSCNAAFTFAEPEVDGFTGYQRGIDLRTSLRSFEGTDIRLNGPITDDFMPTGIPVPANGGEIRTLNRLTAATTLSITGDAEALADFTIQLRAVPTARP